MLNSSKESNDQLCCGEDPLEAAERPSDAGPMPTADEGPTDPNGAKPSPMPKPITGRSEERLD